jgi:acyl-coenzyme A synthetase/AMP-(fatty) acid ligase
VVSESLGPHWMTNDQPHGQEGTLLSVLTPDTVNEIRELEEALSMELAGLVRGRSLISVSGMDARSVFLESMALIAVGFDVVITAPSRRKEIADLTAAQGFRPVLNRLLSVGIKSSSVRVAGFLDTDPFRSSASKGRLLFATSGTTGLPKLIPFEQVQVVGILRALSTVLDYRPDDVILSAIPVSFDYGFYQFLLAEHAGASLIHVPRMSFLSDILATGLRCAATILPITPAYGRALAIEGTERNIQIESVRLVTSTGAPLSGTTRELLSKLFPAAAIVGMYGLTECKRITVTPPAESNENPASVGKVLPGVVLSIRDAEGQEVEAGQQGEGVVLGSHVARGYWNPTSQLGARSSGGLVQVAINNWELRTGDLLSRDTHGWVYHHGRVRADFVKILDQRVSLLSVEEACRNLPAIAECIVYPEYDDDGLVAKLMLAAVILTGLQSSDVHSLLRETVEPIAWRFLEVVEVQRIDMNGNGKVIRTEGSRRGGYEA